MRLRNMQFEDFLEGIVRLSLMSALPTDEEVSALGLNDAGEFMFELRGSPQEMRDFIATNKRRWYEEPRQLVGRCVEALMSTITRVIEANVSSMAGKLKMAGVEMDGVISREEARLFQRRRLKKTAMQVSKRGLGSFQDLLRAMREQTLSALSRVPLFDGLSQEQLLLLRDALSDAPCTRPPAGNHRRPFTLHLLTPTSPASHLLLTHLYAADLSLCVSAQSTRTTTCSRRAMRGASSLSSSRAAPRRCARRPAARSGYSRSTRA